MPEAFRDVQACAAPDACPSASVRAVVQKVDSPANFPSRLAHQDVACTIFLARPASDASAGRDAVDPSASRFPARCPAQVRDSPSARAAQAPPDARQVPQPQAARQKAVYQAPQEGVLPLAPLGAAQQVHSLAGPLVRVDESVSLQEAGLEVRWQAQQALQPLVSPQATSLEAQQGPSEPLVQQLDLSIRAQQVLPLAPRGLQGAPLAQQPEEPQAPRASVQRWEPAQPRPVPEEPRGASAPRAPPLLSPLLLPWLPLPRLPQPPLALKSSCELSPQHLQGSSSSASSSP